MSLVMQKGIPYKEALEEVTEFFRQQENLKNNN